MTIIKLTQLLKSFIAAFIFYTRIPFPHFNNLEFTRIARWCPIVGLLIGLCLGILDYLGTLIHLPILLRSALIVATWLWITGGLHFDGVIDTGDGLAVVDKERRLTVMQDSVVGAYGVMVGIVILILKWAALTELTEYRMLALSLAAGWGRWSQVTAIAFYPYLKPTGKGAFHKIYLKLPYDLILGLMPLIGLNFILKNGLIIALSLFSGILLALITPFWFYHQLGGHTGDSYGAVVEWTETIFLCVLVGIFCY